MYLPVPVYVEKLTVFSVHVVAEEVGTTVLTVTNVLTSVGSVITPTNNLSAALFALYIKVARRELTGTETSTGGKMAMLYVPAVLV